MTVVYLDSSALTKLVVEEPETTALRGFLAQAHRTHTVALATSSLSRAEVVRATSQLSVPLVPLARRVCEGVTLIDLSASLLDEVSVLEPPSLRTLDAIHLASALRERAGLLAFVAYDSRLLAAAKLVGLPVASPGSPGDGGSSQR